MGMEQVGNGWEGLIATSAHRGDFGQGHSGGGNGRKATRTPGPVASSRQADPARQPARRIVVVAEPGLFADGLARSLRMLGSGVEVRIAGLSDPAVSVGQCALVIIDLDGAGDIQSALTRLRSLSQAPIIALARSHDAGLLDSAMRAGAVALLYKSCTESQLLEQVGAVLNQGPAAGAPASASARSTAVPAVNREARPYGLTPGEMDVLRLLREGLTNAQIARERGSKEGTVKIHLDKIYKKLNVQNRTQAICIAARMDSLIDLQARRFEDAEFRFEALSAYVTHEIHREGELLFSAGDQGDSLYYLQRGRVQLVELGKTMNDGDLFGEIGIFSPGHARTCTARCETQVSLFKLSADKAHRLYIENPRFAYHVLRLIAGRLIADRDRSTRAPVR